MTDDQRSPNAAAAPGWSADQSAWPAHLRDDAPRQQCDRCGRFTCAPSEFDGVCRMAQPDGKPCGGHFGAVPV